MAQGCLKCLKITMCVANFLCFICGVSVLGLGVFMNMTQYEGMLQTFNSATILLVSGIIITCVSFLGFLGALKENRCLLLTFFLLLFILMLAELTAACLLLVYEKTVGDILKDDLLKGLNKVKTKHENSSVNEWDVLQTQLDCCGVTNVTDWGDKVPDSCCKDNCKNQADKYKKEGCLKAMTTLFEDNFLTTGIAVIVLCIVEVLGMCFAMTLFCHISRSGLGYKL